MKIGMTGSRCGITNEALKSFNKYLKLIKINEAHHGDCVGADTIFHNLMMQINIPIVIHPPNVDSMRAYCVSNNIRPPQKYLVRNKNIVNDTDILIAFPSEKTEILRSGTWSTIRYASKIGKQVYIFYPDGSTNFAM